MKQQQNFPITWSALIKILYVKTIQRTRLKPGDDIIAQCLQTHIWRKLFLSRIIILHCKHSLSHQKANHTGTTQRSGLMQFLIKAFLLHLRIFTYGRGRCRAGRVWEFWASVRCLKVVLASGGEELIGDGCDEVGALKQGQSAIIINVWHS